MKLIIPLVLVIFIVSCTSNKKEKIFFTVGTDTLSIASPVIQKYAVDSSYSELKNTCIKLVIADTTQVPDKNLITDFKEFIESESTIELNYNSAILFYAFTKEIFTQINNTNSRKALADSLFKILSGVKNSTGESIDIRFPITDTLEALDAFVIILQNSLGCDKNLAKSIFIFISNENKETGESNLPNVNIKGLVYDSSLKLNQPQKNVANPNKKALKKVKSDMKLLLRYRSLGSIKGTIQKESANIQAIYKKHLKLNSSLQGTILVTFTVAPSGKVKKIKIKQSNISNINFQKELIKYLEDITFKSIPESAGDMIFDFPFNFESE